MTGEEFKAIRNSFCMTTAEWGIALGYGGKRANIRQTISRYESGDRPVPEIVARLAYMYFAYGCIPQSFDTYYAPNEEVENELG